MYARTYNLQKNPALAAVSVAAVRSVAAAIARNIEARNLRGRLFADFRGYLA